ncbi:Acg family FMN-binding oxidoreductase [Streptomyces nigra]|uniref:Acg family FMN-binding oxidoreductase n=1 Tax=Streptomyces nigra TaxID=1827580 RepID=UPI0036A7039D
MNPTAPSDEETAALVRDAVAAPSMHNAQPWRFRYLRRARTFDVLADFERAMPHSDPHARALHLGCGAAVLNLRVATAHEGWSPETTLLPDLADRTHVASVRLAGPASGEHELAPLYPAIHQRHSSRDPFEERQISEPLREELAAAAHAEGATLTFPTAWHLQEILELFQEAEARNLTDPGSGQDLARWTGDSASVEATGEGVPAYAYGPRKRGGKAPMRDFGPGGRVAERDAAEFERNPQLALVGTVHDRPEDWLRAGQAMERVLLLATLLGLSASFATQPLEWTDLRWPLRDPSTGTGFTQVVLRVGYGPAGPGAPRRPVSQVLDIEP